MSYFSSRMRMLSDSLQLLLTSAKHCFSKGVKDEIHFSNTRQHTSVGQVLCQRFWLIESHLHIRCDFLSERQEICWLTPFVSNLSFNFSGWLIDGKPFYNPKGSKPPFP